MNEEKNKLLSVPDVVRQLGISRRTVYYWIDKGILKPVRIGSVYRFHPETIETLIREGDLEARSGSAVSISQQPKARILAIDDDMLVRESLKMLLERDGYSIRVVSSAQSALDFFAQEDFDLVITDFKMPEKNGIETIQILRRFQERIGKKPVPEIILTAYDDEPMRRQAEELGVRAIVHKPFELEQFLGLLQSQLSIQTQIGI